MHRARNQAAASERARWLDDLAHAIGQAQRLTWRLGVLEGLLNGSEPLPEPSGG